MTWTWGLSSVGCPDLSLEETLDLAETRAVRSVELRSLSGTTDLPGLFARSYGTPAALSDACRGRTARVTAFGTSFRLMDGSESDWEALLAYAPWAEALGTPYLRVFDGGRTASPEELAQGSRVLDRWRAMRSERGWKTELVVETHDALVGAAALRAFLRAMPEAGLLWDAHHTWRKGGEDPGATWPVIRSSVRHVHAKDSASRPSDGLPYTYVLPGTGEFPFAAFKRALGDGYAGAVCLEWEKLWHPDIPPLAEAIDAAVRNGWI